ncbi:MAG TPA: hypothetical protein VL181_05415 [Holophagaceae bacterium]|jgi:hypothetical protein|nr:hypothetical protein [Holophagaceae bacterium]
MADAPIQAAPKPGMNPVLKWLLIGCGTLVLLMILAFAGCSYFVYSKAKQAKAEMAAKGITFDTSHGLRGMATSATTAAVQGMQPAVLLALPKEEQPAAQKAFKDLGDKGGVLTDQDMKDLGQAMDDYNRANQAYAQTHANMLLNPDSARKFVSDIQAIADRH